MARRLALPTLRPSLGIPTHAQSPTLARARERLGGPLPPAAADLAHRDAGGVVAVPDASGKAVLGVVLCGDEHTCDVWLESGFVKRTRREAVLPAKVGATSPLARIAADALVFGRLGSGQRVRFEPPGREPEVGLLFEKCRYGALIATDSGTVFAVGFRRIWPLPASSDAPPEAS